jgi:hypothetical protein
VVVIVLCIAVDGYPQPVQSPTVNVYRQNDLCCFFDCQLANLAERRSGGGFSPVGWPPNIADSTPLTCQEPATPRRRRTPLLHSPLTKSRQSAGPAPARPTPMMARVRRGGTGDSPSLRRQSRSWPRHPAISSLPGQAQLATHQMGRELTCFSCVYSPSSVTGEHAGRSLVYLLLLLRAIGSQVLILIKNVFGVPRKSKTRVEHKQITRQFK